MRWKSSEYKWKYISEEVEIEIYRSGEGYTRNMRIDKSPIYLCSILCLDLLGGRMLSFIIKGNNANIHHWD